MTTRRPLILDDQGRVAELPRGDSVRVLEPVVVAGFNGDVVHETGTTPVPMFVTTTEGDVVTAGVEDAA